MPVSIKQVEYRGWKNCWRLSNGQWEAIVTADIGPRIISFGFDGGRNLFKNFDHQMGGTAEAEWQIRGGSRIWIAPEDPVASYAPDNLPVAIEIEGNTLIATAPIEAPVALQKQIRITMPEPGGAVEVRHRIRNAALMSTEFAIWVLTVMAPGGIGITGFPPRGTHPQDLPPTNPLVMWAFTDLSDPRWRFTKKYMMLRQDPTASTPQKLGHFNPHTWGAYALDGELFLKRCTADRGRSYPDFGCSFETFTNADMLELETLGPLHRVAPGEWVEHVEHWTLHRDIALRDFTDEELDRVVAPLISIG